jgi:nucleoside-diphosphate-sugar epimerase
VERLAITGAGGLIGSILRAALAEKYAITAIDMAPGDGIDVVADMTDADEAARALEGADLVVDLAAFPSAEQPWSSVRANNIPSTLNALEAAHGAGARRLVFASSNHVTGLYEEDEPYASIVAGRYDGLDPKTVPRITPAFPIRPDGPYGIVKALGEAAGRYYADAHGLSVICLRIGTVNRENRPQNERHFATLLTHNDLVQLVERSLESSVGFGIFYGVSANPWRFWDIEDARERIGYMPAESTDQWR